MNAMLRKSSRSRMVRQQEVGEEEQKELEKERSRKNIIRIINEVQAKQKMNLNPEKISSTTSTYVRIVSFGI